VPELARPGARRKNSDLKQAGMGLHLETVARRIDPEPEEPENAGAHAEPGFSTPIGSLTALEALGNPTI